MEVNDYLPSTDSCAFFRKQEQTGADLVTTPFDAELELTEAETETACA
jgi:hypothetical protein